MAPLYLSVTDGIVVTYNKYGYLDFRPYLYPDGENTVTITLTGNRKLDEKAANAKAKY